MPTTFPPAIAHGADRRAFLKGTALAAGAGLLAAAPAAGDTRPLADSEKLTRIAANTYPIRPLFKRRPSTPPAASAAAAASADEMKKKYGEITLLDFPQFTIDRFPSVRKMDLWSSLFGDVTDDSMFVKVTTTRDGRTTENWEFDPAAAASKKWLGQLTDRMARTGVSCHHVSNNAPRNISDLDASLRRAGISVAKTWLDACATIGAKSMRVNTGGPRIVPGATATTNYPRNDEVVKYIRNAVESFREMADYGGKLGVKVTIENHWGLSADPMNMRIILDEVNHPYCEASPDFCNWEHEYMLYHGLQALLPYTHTTVHAKYWNRWENVDLQRCVRLMINGGFKGVFALEYEDGPWDGVEGAQRLMKEVLAGL
ncbi:Xylose isomerase-like TIM barrel [Luteitalea pratensis]|uniref:Xylose isomerase-like TIM barrel n=1 Tax=Luteitalea pratensis TaxID=1855912 RepID=A0A143PLM4_LUTPR|nr:TIM barrel protein [Luteitalea pratensis]AMY09123.1 Xylose isomerase-like TIM barrel [Luteitalea pratensis]